MAQLNDSIVNSFKKLKKAASFSDIHFGKRANSEQHLQDCIDFVTWVKEQVSNDPTIDHIICMGDWHEHRAGLSTLTMHYSYQAAEILSSIGIPVFLLVGNHDLFHRQTRSVFSTLMFKHIPNIYLIPEPITIEMANGPVLLTPFLFPDEYPGLMEYSKVPVWWGHFEFKGFVISGYNIKMQTGPEHNDFNGPTRIFSGHFHKRQIEDNIVYIGNTFPMDFSDAGDYERGMAVYEYASDDLQFIDWADCPKFIRVKLSNLVNGNVKLPTNSRVKCVIDVPLTYEELLDIKKNFSTEYNLREIVLEESDDNDEALENTEVDDLTQTGESHGLDSMVIGMLKNIDTPKIDQNLLVTIYSTLNIE